MSALRGCDPAPTVCPTRPALHNAVVPATARAPVPAAPAAGRCFRCRKSLRAVDTVAGYSAADRPPTAPARLPTRRLALHRRRRQTQSAPTPTLPSPPPSVPRNGSRRCPSALGCPTGCARSWWLPPPSARFFLTHPQTSRADGFVQRVPQHPQFPRHFRYATPRCQQLLRLLQHFPFQHRRRTVARFPLVEAAAALLAEHLYIALHRNRRYAEGLHNLLPLHCAVHNQLAGELAEAAHVLLFVLEHRQVAVQIIHRAALFLHRDPVVDLCHPGGIERQLQLRHASFLPQPLPTLQHFRLILSSLSAAIHRAEIRRSEGRDYEHAFQGGADRGNTHQGERVPKAN